VRTQDTESINALIDACALDSDTYVYLLEAVYPL